MHKILKKLIDRKVPARYGVIDAFDQAKISGTVFARAAVDGPEAVELYINDLLVLKSHLRAGPKGDHYFEIGMYDVWRFARLVDVISVQYRGQALPMPDGTLSRHPARDGKEDLERLRQRFAAGQSFDETGRITKQSKDLDHTWQDGVMRLYQEVDRIIERVTGSASFIFSGTLLGYIRNSGFIPHDKDMDCAYLSSQSSAAEVASEFAAVADALISEGYCVTPKASCISVRRTTGSKIMVDIAHLFIKPDGTVGFPFGRVGTDQVSPEIFLPVGPGELSGYQVGIPAQPEAVVEHVYGEGWKIPDPGFSWSERRRSRDPEPLLGYSQRTRIAMDDHHARAQTTEPSGFVRWLAASDLVREARTILDLGCGNGRDLPVLATMAEAVIGLDRSRYAVAAANDHVAGHGSLAVIQADVLEPGRLRELLAEQKAGKPRLFYARFLLNGLTDKEQGQLLEELQAALLPGDMLAFEHRTSADEKLRKAQFRSFRRFINTEDFVRKLQQIGVQIIHREEGTGLAPFEREDPHVVRLVAKLPQ